ncbi:MAG TPA: tetratricopeptide repeat protein [Vicinamibacterales bacterium]
MDGYGILLAALIALLVGLTVGKAWERYKLQEGRWIDRRKARESPHYMQGLNFLVANQLDLAIEELSQAARLAPDALEIHMILGNLYREKGQVSRAVQIHQQLLQRPRLGKLEHTYVLLCLGLDYRRGGFVDRAIGAFQEVLRLDPQNEHALLQLEKLYEDQHQWSEAAAIRERLADAVRPSLQPRHQSIRAFLENEIGAQAQRAGDLATAARHFQAAIDLEPAVAPAYVNLGDLKRERGDLAGAIETWQQLTTVAPERAYLVFERLRDAHVAQGTPERFEEMCRRLIAANPQDWRARLALATHLRDRGDAANALELLFESLAINPHAIILHQAILESLVKLNVPRDAMDRYMAVSREAVYYRDPHICLRCRYRSNELLWQCPHCHEWNTFVEERIAAAQDGENIND